VNSAILIGILAALAAAVIGYLVGTLRAARRAESLSAELAEARARIAGDEQQRTRTAELLAQSEAQVRAVIEGASRLALDANSETFLKLAREVFGRDQAAASASLEAREVAIKQLLEPIRESLRKQEEQAQSIVREHRESAGKISGQIENLVKVQDLLQRETRNLSTALRRPEVRGRWGEITLRRVVELAGMSEHCDFTEQEHIESADRGPLRPD
jgi:DNA recombination protein RmuC